ncbi:hypothetical protein [Fimbriiglobus ruber]|uniref:Uncharacterized protein n=1 Tax=Fimbriiglobus ruber TaxID=1908690 RepID=A0A225DUS6_9BACT|nr:hypothetical protein [Fimbriiglobus ruber]OWK45152.1 hypothetical protein FRUB_01483 [Fimbriiglobus ruber]
MFVCQICSKVVPPRTPPVRVVLQRRPKRYSFRLHANVIYRPDSNGKIKEHKTNDPGGVGWETAREANACPDCAAEANRSSSG